MEVSQLVLEVFAVTTQCGEPAFKGDTELVIH